jgi:hypothetical protein
LAPAVDHPVLLRVPLVDNVVRVLSWAVRVVSLADMEGRR